MSDIVNAWFYATGTERKGPFSEADIKALLRAGVLSGHSKVWSEAQPDWTPLFQTKLRTLLPESTLDPPPLPAAESVSPVRHGAVAPQTGVMPAIRNAILDNRTLARVVGALIGINAFISILQIGVIAKARGGLEGAYRAAMLLDGEGVALILLAVFAAAAVPFLWLQYRFTKNLFTLRGPQTVTPAGAVYWYFVPIAWFWKPYEAMRNLVVGLDVEDRATVVIWWVLTWASPVVAIIVGVILESAASVDTVSYARFYVWSSVVLYALDAAWFFFAGKLVTSIASAEATAIASAGERQE